LSGYRAADCAGGPGRTSSQDRCTVSHTAGAGRRGRRVLPGSPRWTLDPALPLTLFVAPVLLDAAYDTSTRDLGANWRPVAGLGRIVAVLIAAVVLGVAIATRILWVMGYSALVMHRSRGLEQAERSKRSWGGGLGVSWAGMRGIVTLAAAFAVPETLPGGSPFPHRDLILLCAFAVFGTLVLQGLTMRPVIGLLKLTVDDPVPAEVRTGCTVIYQALLDSIKEADTVHARLLRKEYQAVVELNANRDGAAPLGEVPGGPLRRHAIAAARHKAIELRYQEIIGEQAHRTPVQELDWAALSAGGSSSA
jgi:hypothetical protein